MLEECKFKVSALDSFEGPVFGGLCCLNETKTVLCDSEKGICMSSAAAWTAPVISLVDERVKEEAVALWVFTEGLCHCWLSEEPF